MPSRAFNAFTKNAQDVSRLLDIHSSLGGSGPGRRSQLEVLNKSAIVLITALWEAYCEDITTEALDHLVKHVPNALALPKGLKRRIAKAVKADQNELSVWTLADHGWKQKVRERWAQMTEERNRRLNTPKSAQIDDLFADALGWEAISDAWRWRGMSKDRARQKLDDFVSLRGSIAHRGSAARHCQKAQVEDYFNHVRRLASRTGGRVRRFVRSVTGKNLF